MRKSILVTLSVAFFLLAGCRQGGGTKPGGHEADAGGAPSAEAKAAPGEPEREYVGEIERLGKDRVDHLVVGVDAPSFKDLAPGKKVLAYWLSMAAIAGNDIMYLQNHRYALPIKAMLEDVYAASAASGDPEVKRIRENLLDYLKVVWINHGQYDHRSSIKFVPGRLTPGELEKVAALAMREGAKLDFLPGKTAAEKLAPLRPHIFDKDFEKRLTVTDPGIDIIAASAVNLYDPGIKAGDLDSAGPEWLRRLNVRFALQEGKVVPQVFSAGCTYGQYLSKVASYLKEAMNAAPAGAYRDSLDLLVKYYETGDEQLFRRHSVAWIGLNDDVEYLSGFIEQLKDPRGVIGNFEGVSAVKADSKIVDRIIADALYFEKRLPWPGRYKRDKVEKSTATIVEVLTGTGDMGPVPWGGYNLPNYDDIRKDHGSKNVILVNILNSYSKTDHEKALAEFYLEADRPVVEKYYDMARKMIVYLHEITGHGSGKSDARLKDDPRNLMGRNFSSLEECRADAVALYLLGDEKLAEYGLFTAGEAPDVLRAAYIVYLTRHLIGIGSLKDDIVTEAHDRAAHLIFQYLVSGGCAAPECAGARDFGVKLALKEGKHFIEVTDTQKMRAGIASLLKKLQVAKATADVKAQDLLFDGLVLDKALRKEITERMTRLDLAADRVMVYPHLVPMKDKAGKIVDVVIKNDEDLVKQQLRYSSGG
jgi:dipeptidyl-peptidase-3